MDGVGLHSKCRDRVPPSLLQALRARQSLHPLMYYTLHSLITTFDIEYYYPKYQTHNGEGPLKAQTLGTPTVTVVDEPYR